MKTYTSSNMSDLEYTRVVLRVPPVDSVEMTEDFEVLCGSGDVVQGRGGEVLVCIDDANFKVLSAEEFKVQYRSYQEKIDGAIK